VTIVLGGNLTATFGLPSAHVVDEALFVDLPATQSTKVPIVTGNITEYTNPT
jgi:hypothetical protein